MMSEKECPLTDCLCVSRIPNGAPAPDASIQLLNNIVTQWAIAQAATSLPPGTLASLAANSAAASAGVQPQAQSLPSADAVRSQLIPKHFEDQKKQEDQRQLRAAFEEEQRKKRATGTASAAASPSKPSKSEDISPAEQLQKSYEAHLQALHQQETRKVAGQTAKASKAPTAKQKSKKTEGDQPMPDEEAGTVLLGLLNSLRTSYEDAVESSGASNATCVPAKKTNQKKRGEPSEILKVAEPQEAKKPAPEPKGKKRTHSKTPNGGAQDKNGVPSEVARFLSTNIPGSAKRPAAPVTDTSSRSGNSSSNAAEFSSSHEDSSDKTGSSSSSEEDDKRSSRGGKAKSSKGNFPNSLEVSSDKSDPLSSEEEGKARSGTSSSRPSESSSSLEDSSDKSDPSSGEEDEGEKEVQAKERWGNDGPPRKRLKSRGSDSAVAGVHQNKRLKTSD